MMNWLRRVVSWFENILQIGGDDRMFNLDFWSQILNL